MPVTKLQANLPHAGLPDRVLGPLVADRECGGCTTCCFIPEIDAPELKKPTDQLCPHCINGGCSIYHERPVPCRSYYCAWRRMAFLPDDFRPDRCGVMISLEIDREAADPFQRLCLVARWLDDTTVLESEMAHRLIGIFRRGNLPMWFSPAGSRRKLLAHPSPLVYRHILAGTPADGDIAGEVARWRSSLPPRIESASVSRAGTPAANVAG